jgi:hypothetical protein
MGYSPRSCQLVAAAGLSVHSSNADSCLKFQLTVTHSHADVPAKAANAVYVID